MPVGGKGWDFVNFLICGGLNVVLGGGVKELPSSMWDISAALSMGTLPLNELVVSYTKWCSLTPLFDATLLV